MYNENINPGKADIELGDFASKSIQLVGRVLGARLGGIMGQESPGGSLQMANIYSNKAKELMSRLTKDRAIQMIHDAVLDGGQLYPKPAVAKVSLLLKGILEMIVQSHELSMNRLKG